MKIYIIKGARILYDYAMALLVFVIFLYPFMGITKDAVNKWLPLYSALLFLFAFFLIYTEMKELAKKEKKPQYEYTHYPLKGLVYGLISIIPITLVTAVFTFIHFDDTAVERIKHVGVNTFLGPLYFIIRWQKEAVWSYFAAILTIPVISALGYLAGHYGIDITKKVFGKKEEPVQQKPFTKSPWNPTLNENNTKKKSKKSKKAGGQ